MKHQLISSIASAGLALFSITAGQAASQDRNVTGSPQNSAESYRGREWQMPILIQVRKDLDRAKAVAVGSGDTSRIDHAFLELTELQGNFSEYWRNQHEFDEVLNSLQKVVTANRLRPQDRDALRDDLAKMREFRANKNAWR